VFVKGASLVQKASQLQKVPKNEPKEEKKKKEKKKKRRKAKKNLGNKGKGRKIVLRKGQDSGSFAICDSVTDDVDDSLECIYASLYRCLRRSTHSYSLTGRGSYSLAK
jgi:hypothetical protein